MTNNKGFTLLELTVVIAMGCTLTAFAVPSLLSAKKNPHPQVREMIATTQLVARANAGNPHRVRLTTENIIVMERNNKGDCNSLNGWQDIPNNSIDLTKYQTTSTPFSMCFNARGEKVGDDNFTLTTGEKRSKISASMVGDVTLEKL